MNTSFCSRLVFVLGTGFALSGCSTLDVDIPAPQVRLPEVYGKSWGLTYGIAAEPAMEASVVEDAQARPPAFGTPRTRLTAALPALFDVGIGSRFQAGVLLGPVSGAAILNLTYQPIGQPAVAANRGNSSVSVYVRSGVVSKTESGDQERLFGPGGFPWRGKVNVAVTGLGASYGYRVTDQILLYTGVAGDSYRATGEIAQDVSTDLSSPGGVYTFNQSGSARSVAIGISSGKLASLSVQAMYNEFEWTNAKKISQGTYAIYLRGAW
ncbi:MAG: hypothetical protein NDI61_04670 [Bdellovibrionaceae bacterium]|nr:hypothetical protein [Pseudobdellovibrionaceae bacterium]